MTIIDSMKLALSLNNEEIFKRIPALSSLGHDKSNGDSPVGTIISFMGSTPPEHYLLCAGQELNITDYLELAGFLKSQFGNVNYFGGDGTATFKLPDLRTTDSVNILYCIKYETVYADQYSLEEQRVGTWINGDPIYRRILKATTPSDNAFTKIYDVTEFNIKEVIQLTGMIQGIDSNNKFHTQSFPWYTLSVFHIANTVSIYMQEKITVSTRNQPVNILLEYTKNS